MEPEKNQMRQWQTEKNHDAPNPKQSANVNSNQLTMAPQELKRTEVRLEEGKIREGKIESNTNT